MVIRYTWQICGTYIHDAASGQRAEAKALWRYGARAYYSDGSATLPEEEGNKYTKNAHGEGGWVKEGGWGEVRLIHYLLLAEIRANGEQW